MVGRDCGQAGCLGGAISRRRRTDTKTKQMLGRIARKALSMGLVVLLLWGQAPVELWAMGVEGVANAAATLGDMSTGSSSPDPEASDLGAAAVDQGTGTDGQDAASVEAGATEGVGSGSNSLGDGSSSNGGADAGSGTGDALGSMGQAQDAVDARDVTGSTQDASNESAAGPQTAGVELSGVELEDPESLQMPVSLTARAYTGSSWSPVYQDEGVTYTWKYSMDDPTSYGFDEDSWVVIEGETGPELVVDDPRYAGAYFSVEAQAGANVVELSWYSAQGPVRLAGQVDIYSAFLAASADASSGTYVYTADQTAYAKARERGSSTTIASESLTYQWQVSRTSRNDGFEDISGGTDECLVLAPYEGCYVRCVISAKVGASTYTTTTTMKVAAQGSVNVTSVSLDHAGRMNVGDTITATARAGSEDVTSSERVVWSWYCGSSATSTDTPIPGANGNVLVVDGSLLGCYIEARADGGFGEEDSSAAGPVVEPGSVELYQVTVTGEARVGSTVRATAYKGNSYTEVSSSDRVRYQWQWAATNTTSDDAYQDIPGATSETYVIDSSMEGRYLRVRATSANSAVSTIKRTYYGDTRVDPLGPVMGEGEYELSGVDLSSTGQAFQVGETVTPTALVASGSYGDDPAPADANLTFAWYVASSIDGTYERLTSGYVPGDGTLRVTEELEGSYIYVEVTAGVNTVRSATSRVMEAGTYDLLRVTTSPQIQSAAVRLFTGDVVDATVWARRLDGSTTNGDNVTDGVSIIWYVGESASGPFAPIVGTEGSALTIPSEAAGKYLKAIASSGGTSVEVVSASPVIDAESLEGIAAKLSDAGWRLEPVYGEDTNANALLEEELRAMGVTDVEVSVSAVKVSSPSDSASLGISTTNDATNGDITYFFMDPDDLTGWAGFTTYRSITPTFTLSRDGESVTFTPERATVMPWDEAPVRSMLEDDVATSLAIGYAQGDCADAVMQDVTLPYKLAGKSWSTVTWSSSDEGSIEVTGYSWDDYTGEVTRRYADVEVTLTARVGVSASGGPEGVTVEVPYHVIVKADPEAVDQARAELQASVDRAFSAGALAYIDGGAVDPAAVAGDLQLPRPSAFGIDGAHYTVAYSADSDAVTVNGYRGNVFRPLPGADEALVALTVTVASKDNPEIVATSTLDLTVAPLDEAEIQDELNLMAAAKDGYAQALLQGQTPQAVTGNLATFQKAYRDSEGRLCWARDAATANSVGSGIVADDLEPDDDMGVVAGHWFKSSDSSVVAHDTLNVVRPTHDVEVTITSALSSERYARYAERYADDATWGPVFAGLTNQTVAATVTVLGTEESSEAGIAVSAQVVGVDAFGSDEVWAAPSSIEVAQGTTAAELTESILSDAGLEADMGTGAYGWYLNSITAPDGRVLSYDDATGRYWQLFVNGAASEVGAGSVVLQAGDEVVWYYSAYGSSLDDIGTAKVTSTVQVIGPDAEGADAAWVGLTEISLPAGSTVADLTERLLDAQGLAHVSSGVGTTGYYLSSITSPYNGVEIGWDEQTGRYWQLFIDGEPAQAGAGQIELEPGCSVVWYYSSLGTELPRNDVQVDSDAWDGRPSDWEAEWEGYAPGAVENSGTPTEGGELAWSVDVGSDIAASVYASDPVIANGRLFVAVGDELCAYDAATGAHLGSALLATSIDSAARVVYSDGLVVVPLHDGRLQVIRADTLVTVTLTDALAEGQQTLSSLTVFGGYAYFGTTSVSGETGAFFCVNLRTGAVRWSSAGAGDAGYYWTGGELSSGYLVTVDASGAVRSIDPATGDVLFELALDTPVRSKPVSDPDDSSTIYVVSRDGTLHKISLGEGGSMVEVGSVSFAAYSTSTPTIANGYAYVGGSSAQNAGVLAVVDLASMRVAHSVTTYGDGDALPGEVKATPTVSLRDGSTYVYFTCNAANGAAYLYRVGDGQARLLHLPSSGAAGWCTANVVVGSDGAVYYLNDSGYLFKLLPGSAVVDPGNDDAEEPSGSGALESLPSARSSLRISLTGNAGGVDTVDEGSLLDRFRSDDSDGLLLAGGAVRAAGDQDGSGMPLWPFAGMGLGALILAAAWMRGRRGDEREDHER